MEDDRERLNFGFVYAAIHNTAQGDPNRDAVQPTDIVPSMRVEKHPDIRGMNGKQVKGYLFKVFGGSGRRSM